jgi:hypothetical protein
MKLLYKPFGLIAGLLAGFAASKIFDFIWARFDNEEPPEPKTQDAPLPKVLGAAALEGLVFRTVRAYVDREGAKGFEWLTGIWPGEKKPDPAGIG